METCHEQPERMHLSCDKNQQLNQSGMGNRKSVESSVFLFNYVVPRI